MAEKTALETVANQSWRSPSGRVFPPSSTGAARHTPAPRSAEIAAERKQSAQEVFDSIRMNVQPLITGSRRQQEGTGLLIGKTGRSGGTIRAIEPGYFTDNIPARNLLTVVDGSLEFDSARSILLGKKIAEKPGLAVGDSCLLLTLLPQYTGNQTRPKMTRFKVAGILSSGYQELDALWIFIPLEAADVVLAPQSSLGALTVSISDPFNDLLLADAKDAIQQLLPAGFSVYTWQDLNRSQFYSFQTEPPKQFHQSGAKKLCSIFEEVRFRHG